MPKAGSNASLQLGVTGGIGSGKSIVCKIFRTLGVPVYDADGRAKELMATDSLLGESIALLFGKGAYDSAGGINRTFIASKVFGKPHELEKLNNLVHPRVKADYENWVQGHQGSPYVIKEAALIFEAGSWEGLDLVVVVSAPEAVRMKRVLLRDRHRSEKDVRNIFESQLSEEAKLERADVIIVNDDNTLVIPQVLSLHTRMVRAAMKAP